MIKQQELRFAELFERHISGGLAESEFDELETLITSSEKWRRQYLDLSHQHARLSMMGDSLIQDALDEVPVRLRRATAWGSCGVAACLMIGLAIWWSVANPPVVATLVSSEHAAWESSSPTLPNTPLPRGFLKLASGVATIRFGSGAQVVLQAPAHLELETPMRAKLVTGSAVVNVPPDAIGFVIDTPNGYAVDHGTEFAVKVDEKAKRSVFEVLSGEISVGHPKAARAVRLQDNQSITATRDTLLQPRDQEFNVPRSSTQRNILRLASSRETSVIRHNIRERFLHSDYLMVKTSQNKAGGVNSFTEFKDFDRISLFEFDLSKVQHDTITAARVRLNLVSTGMGYAAYLPEVNTFAVYGVIDGAAEGWESDGLQWEAAPSREQCLLIGTFDVPRGVQTGSFTLANDTLASFVKADTNGRASFVLVRLTGEKKMQGLVHAFASSSHPESSGPSLELTLNSAP